jgi:hypothetical protein
MNTIQNDIIKIVKDMPYYHQLDLLDYANYLKEKSKRISDTEYLESIPGMVDSIVAASKENIADCSKELDW